MAFTEFFWGEYTHTHIYIYIYIERERQSLSKMEDINILNFGRPILSLVSSYLVETILHMLATLDQYTSLLTNSSHTWKDKLVIADFVAYMTKILHITCSKVT